MTRLQTEIANLKKEGGGLDDEDQVSFEKTSMPGDGI